MNKCMFACFMLFFCPSSAMEKLDKETLKSIDDVYDKDAFRDIKRIEEYFACQQPEIFDDAVDLKPGQGQMKKGAQIIMTPGKPLEIMGKWGTYTCNNCSTQDISEEDMTALIKKKFGAEVVGYQFNDQERSQIFTLSKFEGQTFPPPVKREPSQFVRAEEALHAFNVLSSKHEDEEAVKEFKQTYRDDEVVKEWQPISYKNYKSVDNVRPVYWIPSLGTLKSVLSSWYWWR